MSLSSRLDTFQQRHKAAGFPLAVIYKYFDDQGNYLAALMTYYAFISIFPLLLLLTTILGFVLRGDPQLQQDILNSTLSHIPVLGDQLASPKGLTGSGTGLIIGILGSLYGGLGVAQASQYAMNTAWSVPRNERPNPFKARGRSLVLLATVGLGIIGTTVLAQISNSADAFGARFGVSTAWLILVGTVVLNFAIFLLAFKVACARDVSYRNLIPGAVIAAIFWQLLQELGTTYVSHVVKNASATDGVFAIVLGLIAWLYLAAVGVVFCVEVNVVKAMHFYPRSLLTPFTDAVHLTSADEKAYSWQANAQRAKGFQHVEVTFTPEEADEDEHEANPT